MCLKFLYLILIVFSLSFSFNISAKESNVLTLGDLIQTAISQNSELSAFKEEYNAAGFRPSQAASPPDPKISIGFLEVPDDSFNIDNGMKEYMFEQEIPFPSKLIYAYKAEKRLAEAELENYKSKKAEIIRQIKYAYIDAWRLQEEDKINHRTLSAYKVNLASSETSYASMKGSIDDPVRASVELADIEGQLAIIDLDKINAYLTLSKLTASIIDENSTLKEPKNFHISKNLSELIEMTKKNRPEINRAKKITASEEAKRALAKSTYLPDFSFQAGYIDMPGNQQNAWSGRFGVSVPLWFLSKQRFAVQESKAMVKRAENVKASEELSAETEVKSAYARLKASKKIVDIYSGKVVPRSKVLFNSLNESYKSGEKDLLNLVDSVRTLNNSQLILIRAKSDLYKAEADLERAVGYLEEESYE